MRFEQKGRPFWRLQLRAGQGPPSRENDPRDAPARARGAVVGIRRHDAGRGHDRADLGQDPGARAVHVRELRGGPASARGRRHTMPADVATAGTRLTDAEHRRHLRRAVLASTVGTAIEWYDFFLYSTVTGLVFARLYFPHADPLVGTLEAFGIYAVGFVARPIGAAIFGHYGDRLGRKAALIATLLLMGVATFLVALLPTYQRICIWGSVILTVLRFIQGIGVVGGLGRPVPVFMEGV